MFLANMLLISHDGYTLLWVGEGLARSRHSFATTTATLTTTGRLNALHEWPLYAGVSLILHVWEWEKHS